MREITEKELIQKSQAGNHDAFKQLYERYSPTVFGFCLRMLNNRLDSEDATQITFINLYNKIGQYAFRAKMSTYIMQIAKNTCYDILRRRQKENVVDLQDVPHPITKIDEESGPLVSAIYLLPQQMRAVFILFGVEGYNIKEISTILKISVGTVKATIFQARKKLQNALTKERDSNELQ